jgi:hypothetical protein
MSASPIRLVIGDVEAEVLQEALELYLSARPPQADRRYEYRYRAAQAVLDSLWQQGNAPDDGPPGDDEPVIRSGIWDARNTERLED